MQAQLQKKLTMLRAKKTSAKKSNTDCKKNQEQKMQP